MRGSGWILGGVAALAAAAGMGWALAAQTPALRIATIARVEDGRTLWLDEAGAPPTRARLAWVAVPAAPNGRSIGEPYGGEARRHLEVWKGQRVEVLRIAADRDAVPLVELLWRPTAESVITLNYEMVRSGFARADCVPSGEYALQCRVLRRAEDIARQERRGLWAPRP